MMSKCNFIPDSVWIRECENGIRKITLRRNFTEEVIIHDGIQEKGYTFEETNVYVADRENIQEFVNENFGNLFDLGLQQTEQSAIIAEKIEKTRQAIQTGQIVEDMQTLGQQITNIMLGVV